jgi:hypothetical protein
MFAKAYDIKETSVGESASEIDIEEISIFEAGDPTHRKLQYAVFFNERLDVQTVSQLYVSVIKRLFKMRPDLFLDSHLGAQVKLTAISRGSTIREVATINDEYVIETNLNSKDKFEKIKEALSIFGFVDKLNIKYAQLIDVDTLLAEFIG